MVRLVDSAERFGWGVCVTLSESNLKRINDLWSYSGEQEPTYFRWLSTLLPVYEPTALNLKPHVHARPVDNDFLSDSSPRPPAGCRTAQWNHRGTSTTDRWGNAARPDPCDGRAIST